MFYLKEFFSTLWDVRGRGVFFLLSSFVLAMLTVYRPTISATIDSLAPDAWTKPYFTALFDGTIDREEVMNELVGRPEVAEVQALTTAETSGVLGRIISSLGSDVAVNAPAVAAFGLRVILKNAQMTKSGEELLAGIEESYGSDHVTTSGVRTPRTGGLLNSHPVFQYLLRFGYWGILAPAALIWAAAFMLCFSTFSKRAWLVERFQRRHYVRAKTVAAGLAVVALSVAVTSLLWQGPDVVGMLLCVALFSIPWTATMREVKWRSQN